MIQLIYVVLINGRWNVTADVLCFLQSCCKCAACVAYRRRQNVSLRPQIRQILAANQQLVTSSRDVTTWPPGTTRFTTAAEVLAYWVFWANMEITGHVTTRQSRGRSLTSTMTSQCRHVWRLTTRHALTWRQLTTDRHIPTPSGRSFSINFR